MANKNYKLLISYDGTRYFGWEHQPDKETIQGKIETVLAKMCGVDMVDLLGAGRTDAGVHARGMVASVWMDTDKTPEEIRDYANRYLPDDICILEVRIASDRFHARYLAVGKTYRYTCYIGETKPIFDRRYVTVLDSAPDIEKMKRAAEYLMGKHDFKSFCANARMKKSTVRIVDQITIRQKKDYLYLDFHGTGFLQNMVRIMVGTLLEVGKDTYEPEHVREILEACDRRMAGPTAPAGGLCLIHVDYM